MLGVCIRQVDDVSVVQSAGSFERAKYDDFHEKRYLPIWPRIPALWSSKGFGLSQVSPNARA
jgi:hypothetical protein